MIRKPSRATRFLAAAACAAGCCAGAVRAEPATAAPAGAGMTHERLRAEMAQRHAEHVTALLDRLANRLEIKASQQPAWQGYAAALRDLMSPPLPAGAPEGKAAPDAAALAREHADRAAEHAQKLARLADATAKLEQVLGADQREVLDETARHLTREHGPGPGMAHGGWHGRDGAHCDGHGGPEGHAGMHPGRGPDDDEDGDDAPHGARPR